MKSIKLPYNFLMVNGNYMPSSGITIEVPDSCLVNLSLDISGNLIVKLESDNPVNDIVSIPVNPASIQS